MSNTSSSTSPNMNIQDRPTSNALTCLTHPKITSTILIMAFAFLALTGTVQKYSVSSSICRGAAVQTYIALPVRASRLDTDGKGE
ncbi:hypothetical protein BDZ45DRAFT_676356 [Acephala macrosclerotiorum]|nr:hypothetical protein BDZ45DRAFT_676356 [Acephala macrosclerotiorum]